ncbi:MAG: hypothetical protein ACI4Q4_00835 [Oscillospiraceae bacterium]
MKGLLYASCVLNKKFFIGAGITAAAATIFAVVCELLSEQRFINEITYYVILLASVLPAVIALEFPARDLEKNLKNRFANYALAGGITQNGFVLAELFKNLICVAGGAAVCCIVSLVCMAVKPGYLVTSNIVFHLLIIVAVGVVVWCGTPLTITTKSAEKAGLIIGVCLGFGLILPFNLLEAAIDDGSAWSEFGLFTLISKPWFPWAVLGAAAVIYAVVYLIMLARVKRGDVC